MWLMCPQQDLTSHYRLGYRLTHTRTHAHTRTQTHLDRSLSCNSKHGRHEYSYGTRSSAVARRHLLNASTFGFDRLGQRSIYGQPSSPNIILKVHFFFTFGMWHRFLFFVPCLILSVAFGSCRRTENKAIPPRSRRLTSQLICWWNIRCGVREENKGGFARRLQFFPISAYAWDEEPILSQLLIKKKKNNDDNNNNSFSLFFCTAAFQRFIAVQYWDAKGLRWQ